MGLLDVLGLTAFGKDLDTMLVRTGRAGAVSDKPDLEAKLTEQTAFDADRAKRRAEFLSDVYSKTEIAFNQREMEAAFAKNAKIANAAHYQQAKADAALELDTQGMRENLRLGLSGGKDKAKTADMDAKVEAAVQALIERKANDALGLQVADRINTRVLALIAAKLTHPPSADEMKAISAGEMNGYVQSAIADMEENDADVHGAGLAHYDSRHTRPDEADQLARVANAVSPDLKQKSVQTGTIDKVIGGKTVTVPVYAGRDTSGTVGVVTNVANKVNEKQTNHVSTVKSPAVGLFVIEDAMAQAWEQSRLDKTAQNVGAESKNLTYEFGQGRDREGGAHVFDATKDKNSELYAGGLGDTYSAVGGGSHGNLGTLRDYAKIKSRLAAATITPDNPGAKLIMKQDKLRGGFDPYTMMSQVNVGTGMKRFKRDGTGALIPNPLEQNRPTLEATDWDAADKAHAKSVEEGMTLRKGVAGTALQDAVDAAKPAEAARKNADQAFQGCIDGKFAGKAQDAVLGAARAAVQAQAKLDDMADLRVDAEKLVTQAGLRLAAVLQTITAARQPLAAAAANAEAAVKLADTAANQKLRDDALAALAAFDGRALETRQRYEGDKKQFDEQIKRIDEVIKDTAAALADAESKRKEAVAATGMKADSEAIKDLLAKAETKARADAEQALRAEVVNTATRVLALATQDETKAKEARAQVDSGGLDQYLAAQLKAAKDKAKADLGGALDSAATPQEKAKLLKATLAQARQEAAAMQKERGGQRGAQSDRAFAAFAAVLKEEADAAQEVAEIVAAQKKLAGSPGSAQTRDALELLADTVRRALDAAKARTAAAEAFELARLAEVSDLRLLDDAEDARAEAETLLLAAEVAQAKGAGAPGVNAARKDLADKLDAFRAITATRAESGRAQRKAAAAVAALTREQAKSLQEKQALLAAQGVQPTPNVDKRLAKVTARLQLLAAGLAAPTAALDKARVDRQATETPLALALRTVAAAREALALVDK